MSPPLVSVLVVIKNERDYIEQCIESLINQDYPRERYEIVVVDGMSTDGTRGIVSKLACNHHNICLADNPKGIYPSGLNIGLKKAQGDIVIKLDGHAYVEKDFISKNVEYLCKTGAACVGGLIQTVSQTYLGGVIACVLSSPFGVGNARFRYYQKEGYVDTVPYGAYWKRVFDEAGPFDENRVRTEDLDLHYRIRKAGGKFYLTPEIKSYYYCRSTLKGLAEQAFISGQEVVTALHAISIRHLVPLAFVLGLVASGLLWLFTPLSFYLFSAIAGSYLVLAIVFSLSISAKRGWRYFWVLPIVFACFHISYGIGSVVGLVRRGRAALQRAIR